MNQIGVANVYFSLAFEEKPLQASPEKLERVRLIELDGVHAERIDLDEKSYVVYVPSILDGGNSDGLSEQHAPRTPTADGWYTKLEKVLTTTRASQALPLKGKCTGSREQYYGDDQEHEQEERGLLRANPRWLTSAQPLTGAHMGCVLEIKSAVETWLRRNAG